jgi:hypothetical protein
MKNKLMLIGIIALVALMGFSMIGCKEDSVKTDDLLGEWKNDDVSIVFAINEHYRWENRKNVFDFEDGTYKIDKKEITFTPTGDKAPYKCSISKSGDELTLTNFFNKDKVTLTKVK